LINIDHVLALRTDEKICVVFVSSRNLDIRACINDKDLEREMIEQSREFYEQKTLPGLYFSQNMGNMYTPSLYYSLLAFLIRFVGESISFVVRHDSLSVNRMKSSCMVDASYSFRTGLVWPRRCTASCVVKFMNVVLHWPNCNEVFNELVIDSITNEPNCHPA
jgi:hypothetical protein